MPHPHIVSPPENRAPFRHAIVNDASQCTPGASVNIVKSSLNPSTYDSTFAGVGEVEPVKIDMEKVRRIEAEMLALRRWLADRGIFWCAPQPDAEIFPPCADVGQRTAYRVSAPPRIGDGFDPRAADQFGPR